MASSISSKTTNSNINTQEPSRQNEEAVAMAAAVDALFLTFTHEVIKNVEAMPPKERRHHFRKFASPRNLVDKSIKACADKVQTQILEGVESIEEESPGENLQDFDSLRAFYTVRFCRPSKKEEARRNNNAIEMIKQEEEEKAKKIGNSKNQICTPLGKPTQSTQNRKEAEKEIVERKPIDLPEPQSWRVERAVALHKVNSKFINDGRVTRWSTKIHEKIQQFRDGNEQKYLKMEPDQTSSQRREHYLPGVEIVLSDSTTRDVYFQHVQEHDREGYLGFAVMYDKQNKRLITHGAITIGIKGKKIYHLKLVHTSELPQDKKKMVLQFIPKIGKTTPPNKEFNKDWVHTSNYEFSFIESSFTLRINLLNEDYYIDLHPAVTNPEDFLGPEQ